MTGVAILSCVFVLYALMASRLDRLSITAPMVFVLTGVMLGSGVTDLIDISLTSEPVLLVVELTLALLLFADASTIRLREVEDDARLPSRLLLIGLPLTIAFGTVIGALLFPAAGWAAAALIASILAPTDAALGLAIFTNPAVPVRIRRALNVESGLNDGIATPFVALFLTVLVSEEAGGAGDWLIEAGKEIGLALIVAVGVGVIGGRLLRAAQQRGSISEVSEQLGIVSLALLAYLGSVAIGGNGFIAAFVGGLTFGASTRGSLRRPTEFTETLGLFSSFFVWTVFGAIFVGPVLTTRIDATAIVYAVLEPHPRADGARRDLALGDPSSVRHRRVDGVVRPTRVGLRRLHARRGRGDARVGCGVRRHRRSRDVDDPPLGHGARAHGRSALACLRTADPGCRWSARALGRTGASHPPTADRRWLRRLSRRGRLHPWAPRLLERPISHGR